MIVTVVPRTVHAPLPANETVNPELLVALTWNDASPYLKPVGSGPNEIVCAAYVAVDDEAAHHVRGWSESGVARLIRRHHTAADAGER